MVNSANSNTGVPFGETTKLGRFDHFQRNLAVSQHKEHIKFPNSKVANQYSNQFELALLLKLELRGMKEE